MCNYVIPAHFMHKLKLWQDTSLWSGMFCHFGEIPQCEYKKSMAKDQRICHSMFQVTNRHKGVLFLLRPIQCETLPRDRSKGGKMRKTNLQNSEVKKLKKQTTKVNKVFLNDVLLKSYYLILTI